MRLSVTAKEKGDRSEWRGRMGGVGVGVGRGGVRKKKGGRRVKGWKREVKMRKSVGLEEERRRCGQFFCTA